jgi:AraC family transcriptional regulator
VTGRSICLDEETINYFKSLAEGFGWVEAPMNASHRCEGFFGVPVVEWRSEALFLTERTYRPGQVIAPHEHRRPYVCVVVDGSYRERSDLGERECRRASVLLHPAGSRHSDRFFDQESRLLLLELEADSLPPIHTPEVFDAGPVCSIGARIHHEAHRLDEFSPLALEGLLLELIAASRRQRAARDASPRWLAAARQQIDDALPLRATVRKLAADAGVHPAHFARVFRAHLGCTVADYVRQQRVGRAKEQLTRGVPIAEAALSCGFADQSHLTRSFKRVLGVTPEAFRRAIGARS